MKVDRWILPTNGGEALTIVVGDRCSASRCRSPPVQILWINMVTAVTLGADARLRADRARHHAAPAAASRRADADASTCSGGSASSRSLFLAGAFGVFFWPQAAGGSLETARTMVVNTLVAMEIVYLFSVRYVHGTSLTWQGVLGTPAVLIGVGSVAVAQLAFTYLPVCHTLFGSRALSFVEGAIVIAIGVVAAAGRGDREAGPHGGSAAGAR